MKNMLTKDAFAEWCEKQPPDEHYVWSVSNICACAQYAKGLGLDYPAIFTDHVLEGKDGFWTAADLAAEAAPRTFGALAQRLRSIPS